MGCTEHQGLQQKSHCQCRSLLLLGEDAGMVHSAAITHLPPGCSEGSAQPPSRGCAANTEGCELCSTESYDTRTSYGLHAQSKETGLCYHNRRAVLESATERQQVSNQAARLGRGQRAASRCPSGGHKAVPWLGPAAGRPLGSGRWGCAWRVLA